MKVINFGCVYNCMSKVNIQNKYKAKEKLYNSYYKFSMSTAILHASLH